MAEVNPLSSEHDFGCGCVESLMPSAFKALCVWPFSSLINELNALKDGSDESPICAWISVFPRSGAGNGRHTLELE